jgi:hypothetical protein
MLLSSVKVVGDPNTKYEVLSDNGRIRCHRWFERDPEFWLASINVMLSDDEEDYVIVCFFKNELKMPVSAFTVAGVQAFLAECIGTRFQRRQ